MAAWGLLFHYIIATGFVAIYVISYQQIKLSSRNIILNGLLYGLLVWVMMNRVIVPLSETPTQPFVWEKAIVAMLILMLFIGLSIALVTKRYYPTVR